MSHLVLSCSRKVTPTIDNINKIFDSRDFTFSYHPYDKPSQSLSFRVDYLVYKSDAPTYRRTITYDEVLLINDFIQQIVRNHNPDLNPDESDYFQIKNTAYQCTITPDPPVNFQKLIQLLNLPD